MPQVKMNTYLLSSTPHPEELIEQAGRICYNSKPSEKFEDLERFIKKRISECHFSILEHASASFYITGISRACSHQLSCGIKPEDARFILPNACATEIIMTMNFRQWREFIQKRYKDKKSQWEIKALAENILDQLLLICPSVFEDLKKEPE